MTATPASAKAAADARMATLLKSLADKHNSGKGRN